MRLVFLNPHKSAFFGITLLNFVSRIHSTTRYKYLLQYLSAVDKKIYLFLTPNASSLPSYLSSYLPIKIELFLWALINKISPLKLRFFRDFRQLKKDDILFSLTLRTFDNHTPPTIPTQSRFLKVLHVTHYNNFTSTIANNLKNINPDILVAENNLTKNSPYFRKHFGFYQKNVYTLPYVFEKRFSSSLPFSQRLNKCLATGSVVTIKDLNDSGQFTDFERYYRVDSLTPLRKTLLENKDRLTNLIDTLTSRVFEHQPKYPDPKDNLFAKISKSIYNGIAISKLKYFKFNIVQKYNQYKMFVIPEEITLPSVGFVEGMACGCAYLGLIDPMYTDLGLQPGKHYLGYDGSLKDLLAKIAYYQKHPSELETIAQNGHDFVVNKFNGTMVTQKFIDDLKRFSRNRKQAINSSFTLSQYLAVPPILQ